MKKSIIFCCSLLFTALLLLLFFPACINTPQVKTQNYHYIDQVYYKTKLARLVDCLKKPENRDSCKCLDDYW